MAVNIGPKIGIDGEKEFRTQLNNIIQQTKTLDSEMKALVSSFTDETTAQERSTKTAKLYAQQVEAQQKRIDLLSQMVDESAKKYGEADSKTLKWKQALADATTQMNQLEKEGKDAAKQTDGLSDSMDDGKKSASKISDAVDDVGKSLDDSGKSASMFGDMLKANLTSEAIVGGIKTMAGAIWEISKGLVNMASSAVQSFAELEQNLGGSDAVFQNYANVIQTTAESAYKTMGTTQSEYLATANKIGALFQGSGVSIDRSVELTTQAMQRAADMASVMGIDTSSALEAITGAAKGNYTMMDNLGVAMNATTLSAYALEKGFDTAFSKMSNAEKAEVAMQYFFENTTQYANNFEKEASSTVSGSLGMLTSAVQTFVAGLGNADSDMIALTDNVVDAFNTTVAQIVPVVQNIVSALPTVVSAAVPAILSLMPSVLSAGMDILETLVSGILSALPSVASELPKVLTRLLEFVLSALPEVLKTALIIVENLATGIGRALPTLIPAAVSAVVQLTETLIDHIDLIIDAALSLVSGLADGVILALPVLLSKIPILVIKLVNALISKIPDIIQTGTKVMSSLLDNSDAIMSAWFDNLPLLISGLLNGILENLPAIQTAGFKLLSALITKIPEVLKYYASKFPSFWSNIFEQIKSVGPKFVDIGKKLLQGMAEKWPEVLKKIIDTLKNYGGQMIKGIWSGMSNVSAWLWNKVRSMLSGLTDKIKSFFGIHSPSRLFEDEIGNNLALGIGVGFEDTMKNVTKDMADAMPTRLGGNLNSAPISITVNGAVGQDVNQLADIVAYKLQNQVARRGAVYA